MELPKEMYIPKFKGIPDDFSMILFGPPKVGKTTFAAQFPDSLILECEHQGADLIKCKKLDLKSYDDFRKAFLLLKDDKGFKTIVIDSLDIISSWIEKEICNELNIPNILTPAKSTQKGAQWGMYKDRFLDFVNTICSLNKRTIFISHSKKAEIDDSGNVISPRTINLYGQTAIQLMSQINNIGYMFAKELPGNIVKRYISFAPGAQIESGSREPALSGRILEIPKDTSYQVFEKCFEDYAKKANKVTEKSNAK